MENCVFYKLAYGAATIETQDSRVHEEIFMTRHAAITAMMEMVSKCLEEFHDDIEVLVINTEDGYGEIVSSEIVVEFDISEEEYTRIDDDEIPEEEYNIEN